MLKNSVKKVASCKRLCTCIATFFAQEKHKSKSEARTAGPDLPDNDIMSCPKKCSLHPLFLRLDAGRHWTRRQSGTKIGQDSPSPPAKKVQKKSSPPHPRSITNCPGRIARIACFGRLIFQEASPSLGVVVVIASRAPQRRRVPRK